MDPGFYVKEVQIPRRILLSLGIKEAKSKKAKKKKSKKAEKKKSKKKSKKAKEKKSKKANEEKENFLDFISDEEEAEPNIVLVNVSQAKEISTKKFFSRAGVLPYCIFEGKRYYFFSVFSGYDKGKFVTEISDFGGGVKHVETFVRGAVRELIEESLGVFDYERDINILYDTSLAVRYDNNEVIILMTEIDIGENHPSYISEMFTKARNEVKPRERSVKFLHKKIEGYEKPKLELSRYSGVDHKIPSAIKRKTFDPTETKDILYITGEDIVSLLEDDSVIVPEELNNVTSVRYKRYPKIYYAISNMFRVLNVKKLLL